MGGVSSEAAQKAGGGAMSTRDELIGDLNGVPGSDWDMANEIGDVSGIADALIAEGWRKKPSRTQLAGVIDKAQADFLREDLPEDGRTEKATIADAVLALMDGGQ